MVSGFPLAATDGFPRAPDDAGAEELPAGGLDELLPLDPLLHAAALRARTESPAARTIRFMLDIPPLSECIRCPDVPRELCRTAAAASPRDARPSRGDRVRCPGRSGLPVLNSISSIMYNMGESVAGRQVTSWKP